MYAIPLRDRVFAVVVIAAGVYASMLLFNRPEVVVPSDTTLAIPIPEEPQDEPLPDFGRYNDIQQKKQAFFSFLLPLVERENQQILALREKLLALKTQSQHLGYLESEQLDWLKELAVRYRVTFEEFNTRELNVPELLDMLLERVDIVPASLALSQSANESAWGTSRFAVEGNNLFGQWCFREGCGLVPKERDIGAIHEVAAFSSPAKSIASYIHNLNTNHAYLLFRSIRREQREQNAYLDGNILALGLESYSIRGEDYINELQALIRINQLSRYDQVLTSSSYK